MLIQKHNTEVKIVAEIVVGMYTLKLREDGILHCHISSGFKWSPNDYNLLLPAIEKIVNKKKIPLMVTYDELVFPSQESIKYSSNPSKISPYISADAHILNSLPLKILGNFYLKIKRPLRPTKIFDNRDEATAWLKTFL
ncbi:DUF7793 family protein [Aurantibacillus circumpalustris]|uniref:DUF7793 family protein n=1 Tax=Aurantibacillus circumpalustris TaxID=3036359 RepID=UPI00295A571C|nr:hypothetical protein [Aurantibacillus circumpalustris]